MQTNIIILGFFFDVNQLLCWIKQNTENILIIDIFSRYIYIYMQGYTTRNLFKINKIISKVQMY